MKKKVKKSVKSVTQKMKLRDIELSQNGLLSLNANNKKSADMGWEFSGLISVFRPITARMIEQYMALAQECGGEYNRFTGSASFDDDEEVDKDGNKIENPRTKAEKLTEYTDKIAAMHEIEEEVTFTPLTFEALKKEGIRDTNGEFETLRHLGLLIRLNKD